MRAATLLEWALANGCVSDCIFTDCSSDNDGGAISCYGDDCNVSYCSFTDCSANYVWGRQGHEIAFGQGVFVVDRRTDFVAPSSEEIQVIHGEENIGVRGEHFEAIFSDPGKYLEDQSENSMVRKKNFV